jgi:hypothetical protein
MRRENPDDTIVTLLVIAGVAGIGFLIWKSTSQQTTPAPSTPTTGAGWPLIGAGAQPMGVMTFPLGPSPQAKTIGPGQVQDPSGQVWTYVANIGATPGYHWEPGYGGGTI